jgi:hypothetical protein
MLLATKGFAILPTVAFLVFLMAPLLLSDDPVGLIYSPTNPFLLHRVYLGACSHSITLSGKKP